MASASDNKFACASEAANAINDIMRLDSADYGPLLDAVMMYYFLYFLEDNREHLEDSDLDSDATHPNISYCRTSFNCSTSIFCNNNRG